MITKAIVAQQPGGPEVFTFRDLKIGLPGPSEVLIQHKAIGVNFIDTYFRNGIYPWPGDGPVIVGAEGSGIVLAKGKDVTDLNIGERIAYTLPHGAYCQHRILPRARVVRLPDDISYDIAAAAMLKGLTVHYLLQRTFKLLPGHMILFHAAAGGVGSLAGQWAAKLGATIIGTVSTDEKAQEAIDNGYHHVINYQKENFVERVLEITHGEGVDAVYDSVGQNTYPDSLKCIKRLGMWVCFGQSSGLIKNFELGHLAKYGSLFATRPSLFNYVFTQKELEDSAAVLFQAISDKTITVKINQQFNLAEAADAHHMLENRLTKGSTILIP